MSAHAIEQFVAGELQGTVFPAVGGQLPPPLTVEVGTAAADRPKGPTAYVRSSVIRDRYVGGIDGAGGPGTSWITHLLTVKLRYPTSITAIQPEQTGPVVTVMTDTVRDVLRNLPLRTRFTDPDTGEVTVGGLSTDQRVSGARPAALGPAMRAQVRGLDLQAAFWELA